MEIGIFTLQREQCIVHLLVILLAVGRHGAGDDGQRGILSVARLLDQIVANVFHHGLQVVVIAVGAGAAAVALALVPQQALHIVLTCADGIETGSDVVAQGLQHRLAVLVA